LKRLQKQKKKKKKNQEGAGQTSHSGPSSATKDAALLAFTMSIINICAKHHLECAD